jgi:hypothetical protein
MAGRLVAAFFVLGSVGIWGCHSQEYRDPQGELRPQEEKTRQETREPQQDRIRYNQQTGPWNYERPGEPERVAPF